MIAGLQIVRLYIVFSITISICRASYVTQPNINFDSLEKLGISGSYNGISLYKDTNQLTQIPRSTSSIISLSNDTLKLVASSNVNGTIYDACILSNKLFVAGSFSTIKGQIVNNIASIDLKVNQLTPLKYGLDGAVHSIFCDTANQQVYVGGSFIAPVDVSMISYSDSLSQFGGGVAIWKKDQWVGLPWKGVNGPVYSIIQANNNSILFAGQFNASTDGQPHHAPATQPIRLSSTGVIATNTASNSASPGSIICADATNMQPWILSDGVKGTWQASFPDYNVNPVLIRISNSKMDNHQTNQFSIRSLEDSAAYQLSYFDPDANLTKTCSTDCSLSKNTNVLYQDFRITNISLTSGIAIDIKSWHGVGGGLASVKIFQSEIFAYAVDPQSKNICTSTSSINSSMSLPRVASVGAWTSSNTTQPYLLLQVSSAALASPPSVTFYPNLAESGLYKVVLYTPGCASTGCAGRVNVDVIVSASASQKSNITVTPSTATSQSVFSGYFQVSSTFTPTVQIALSQSTTFSANSTMTMVAHAVQFIKIPSVDFLSNIIEYNTTQTISAASIPWGKLADNLPSQSIVKSMGLSNSSLYIAGSFNGIDKSNGKYTNIVQYDMGARQLKALQNEGFDGLIESLVCTDTEVFVGGSFMKVSGMSANVENLSNVARYNIQRGAWSALHGGVDGPVLAMNWVKEKQSIIVSGEFTQLLKTNNEAYSISSAGTAVWNTLQNQWNATTDTPYLSGVVYSTLNFKENDYYLGNLKSAQRYQSSGVSFISNSSILSSLNAFQPYGSSKASIRIGVLYNKNSVTSNLAKRDASTTSNATATIFGGQFSLPGNIHNVAIYDNGVWSGVQGADWQGTINTMTVNNDLLYVGGRFSGSTSNNLAVFDLNNKSLSLGPTVKTTDGSPASINIIRHITSQNAMVVGGNFTSVDSMACSSICSISTTSLQWSTLGSGLVGEVSDVQLINGKLVATGNISLNNSPLTIAEYDFEKSTWGPFGTADLPGPSSSLSYDNVTQHVYVSGRNSDTSAATYFRIWNGQQFITPKSELGPGSSISSLSMVPLITTEKAGQNVLLVSGFINLGILGNVSAAFYDGDDWTPYLVTSDANGDTSSALNKIFYLEQIPFTASSMALRGTMAQPLVIIVSVSISLGVVFLIVLCSLIFVYFKRKRNTRVSSQPNPGAYYGNPPRKPDSLLAALNAVTPDGEKYEKENDKPFHLQPENQQLYNMSKSLSQEHLHEKTWAGTAAITPTRAAPSPPTVMSPTRNAPSPPTAMTTARATPSPPTAHSRSFSPQQQQQQQHHQYNTMFGNTTPVNYNTPIKNNGADIVSIPTVSHDAARPKLYAKFNSQSGRKASNDSFYNNEYTNAGGMKELPRSMSPFNPFRASELGLAVSGNELTATVDINRNNSGRSERQVPTFTNIGPAEKSTIAVVPSPEYVRWTNASTIAAAKSTAIVKPVSFTRLSGESSFVYGPGSSDKSGNVRWTNAPSSKDALGIAIAVPAVPSVVNYPDSNYLSHPPTTPLPNIPSKSVRWTNYNTEGAVGTATIDPVPNNLDHFELSAAFSADPDIVRLTTADKNNDTATNFIVEPSETSNDSNSYPVRSKEAATTSPHTENYSTLFAGRGINTNVFRTSDAGSLAPLDTTSIGYSFNKDTLRQDTLSPDSSVRWKTAKAGSPIETVHAPDFLEPASARVTRRSTANEENATVNLTEYYSPQLSRTKPIDNGIPNRALDDHRALINEEESVSTKENYSPSGVNALNGRASSKQMVKKYRTASITEDDNKRPKHKSDFKSIMFAAIKNNSNIASSKATEDHPHLYYAKFDFSASEEGELGFKKGNPIIVVSSEDEIWWLGYKADKSNDSFIQGVFPSNYVTKAIEIREL